MRALVPGRHKTDFIVTKGQNKNKRSMLTMFTMFFSFLFLKRDPFTERIMDTDTQTLT